MDGNRTYIIDVSANHVKLIAKMLYVAEALGEKDAKSAMEELSLQVDGVALGVPERYGVWVDPISAPEWAREIKGLFVS